MAFADPTSTNQGQTTVASVSHTINLPALATGDLLVVYHCINANTTVIWPAGWTEIFDAVLPTNAARAAVAYHLVTGAEGYTGDGSDTIIVTSASSRLASHISHRYVGAEDPATQAPTNSTASGTSTNPDPPSHAPGSTEDFLWVAVSFNDRERATSAFPTGFGLVNLNEVGSVSAAVGVATAAKKLNASSDDPSTFTITTSDDWLAATFAIWPVSGAGGGAGGSFKNFATGGQVLRTGG